MISIKLCGVNSQDYEKLHFSAEESEAWAGWIGRLKDPYSLVTKSGPGYFVSSSSETKQCYNLCGFGAITPLPRFSSVGLFFFFLFPFYQITL